jgi:hypothetical protein
MVERRKLPGVISLRQRVCCAQTVCGLDQKRAPSLKE